MSSCIAHAAHASARMRWHPRLHAARSPEWLLAARCMLCLTCLTCLTFIAAVCDRLQQSCVTPSVFGLGSEGPTPGRSSSDKAPQRGGPHVSGASMTCWRRRPRLPARRRQSASPARRCWRRCSAATKRSSAPSPRKAFRLCSRYAGPAAELHAARHRHRHTRRQGPCAVRGAERLLWTAPDLRPAAFQHSCRCGLQ